IPFNGVIRGPVVCCLRGRKPIARRAAGMDAQSSNETVGIRTRRRLLALIRDMNEAGQETFRVNDALRDWLVAHGQLPIDAMDEDTETKGARRERHRCPANAFSSPDLRSFA